MKKKAKKYAILISMLLLLPLSFIVIFTSMDHNFATLPYYGEDGLATTTENGTSEDTTYYKVPDYQLIDENGNTFSLDSLRGDVWIAAFYTTSSPYISKITKRLLSINFQYRGEEDIKIVSFSTDPENDNPEALQEYLTSIRSQPEKWKFLTGDPQKMEEVIQEGFLLEDYKNSAILWLVDTEGHLRGKFNGNSEEEIKDAIEAIALLKKEIDIEAYEREKAESN